MISCGFFNSYDGDRKYYARDFSNMFSGFVMDGVFQHYLNRFNVTAVEGFKIGIDSGKMWYNEGWLENDSMYTEILEQPDLLYDRIDAVVAHFDDPDLKGGRYNDIIIKKGIPAEEPEQPTLINTDTVKEVPLAYILVKTGATEIIQANISYMVGQTPCPFVTGLLETMSIDDQVAQWNSEWEAWSTTMYSDADTWYDNFKATNTSWEDTFKEENITWADEFQAEMLAWYAHLQDELDENQAINLQLQIDLVNIKVRYLPNRAAYDALTDAEKDSDVTFFILDGTASTLVAGNIPYNNTNNDLEAMDVQNAIDEVNNKIDVNVTDVVTNYGSATYNTLEAMIAKWISLGMLVDLSGNPDNTTFAGIKNAVNQNVHMDILSVGDEVTASDGEVYVVMHLDYNLSTYGHNVLFCKKYCLPTARQMNPTNTNVGGFGGSAMSAYLDGGFYNNLPSDMKPYISTFTYQAGVGNSTALQNETHHIWLPLEYNVFGATTCAAATEVSTGGAQQFDYFATAGNRIKKLGEDGSVNSWWLSSPLVDNSTSFCRVTTVGAVSPNSASNSCGVLPCFAILADA